MIRTLRAIISAIILSSPTMPKEIAHGYAEIVQRESVKAGIDPLDLVALVHSESRWRAGATNYMGCQGLTQICPQFMNNKAALLDPATNLRLAAGNIRMNREFCKKKVGKSARLNWLFSLGGYNIPSQNIYCGMKKTKKGWKAVATPASITRLLKFRSKLPK